MPPVYPPVQRERVSALAPVHRLRLDHPLAEAPYPVGAFTPRANAATTRRLMRLPFLSVIETALARLECVAVRREPTVVTSWVTRIDYLIRGTTLSPHTRAVCDPSGSTGLGGTCGEPGMSRLSAHLKRFGNVSPGSTCARASVAANCITRPISRSSTLTDCNARSGSVVTRSM
jgi:hypothetical protein